MTDYSSMYESKPDDYFEGMNSFIFERSRKLPPNSNVLEVGCANGNLGAALRKTGINVYGIELVPEAARKAEQKLNHVLCGDIETLDLPYEHGFFDQIIFGDVLEHLRDPWGVLRKVKPFLKSTGSIVACIPNIGHVSIIQKLLTGQWAYEDSGLLDRTHLRFFTLNEMINLFQSTGYSVTAIDRGIIPHPLWDHLVILLDQVRMSFDASYPQFSIEAKVYQYVIEAKMGG